MKTKKNLSRNVALCYVRQSVTKNGEDMTSPQRQIELARNECERRGWEFELFVDADGHKSGQDENNRPQWLSLKRRLADPDVVALVAYDQSRLHRKMWRMGQTIELCKEYGVQVVFTASYMDWFNKNPDNGMMFYFQAMKDELEARQTSEKIKQSSDYRKSKGQTLARAPFGTIRVKGYLQPSPKGAWLLPDGTWVSAEYRTKPPQKGALWRGYFDCLKFIMETYAKGHYSNDSITTLLQDAGWAYCNRAYEPVAFEVDDVRRIIANWPQYGGLASTGRAKEARPKAMQEEIVLNPERAVLDVNLLYQVGNVRKERSILLKDTGVNKRDFRYPLAGLVYCAHCERLAQSSGNPKYRSRLSGKAQVSYRHKRGASCGCNHQSVPRYDIEGGFYHLLGLLDVKPEYLELMAQWALELDGAPQEDIHDFEIKKQEEIMLCQRRIEAAIHLYGEGRISRAEYQQRIEHNEREIIMWQARTSEKEQVIVELTQVKELIGQTARLWHNASEHDKQGLAQMLFEYIVYDLDKKQIVDFRLKGWTERFLTLRGGLYAVDNDDDDKGTKVTTPRPKMNRLLSHLPLISWNT